MAMTQRIHNTSGTAVGAERMLLKAVGARVRPMTTIMGPVTTGGKKLVTRSTPKHLTNSASTRYKAPATMMPPVTYGKAA